MDPGLVAGGAVAVAGAGLAVTSLVTTRRASTSAIDYVRSLDAVDAGTARPVDGQLVRTACSCGCCARPAACALATVAGW